MKQGKTYIIIRLSSLGDVAMALPAIYEAAEEHPQDTFYLLTQPFMCKMVVHPPANLSTIAFRKDEDGSFGQLIRLSHELHKLYPNAIIVDLHDVLRTKWLRTLLKSKGHSVFTIDKPRRERHQLLEKRTEAVVPKQLYVPRMTDIYVETLTRAGITILSKGKMVLTRTECSTSISIGIAPYAQYRGKMITREQTLALIDTLKETYPDADLILYGAAGSEARSNRELVSLRPQSVRTTSAEGIQDEIHEIAQLDCMISMDSANQHIAAMVGTPVVSIWGATHPAAGFMAFRTQESTCMGLDMPCRPCSIYGNKPCSRDDYACLEGLSIPTIVDTVSKIIAERHTI